MKRSETREFRVEFEIEKKPSKGSKNANEKEQREHRALLYDVDYVNVAVLIGTKSQLPRYFREGPFRRVVVLQQGVNNSRWGERAGHDESTLDCLLPAYLSPPEQIAVTNRRIRVCCS